MAEKDDIINRLRRVEGQIKGIQKMVDEGQFCGDILIQIAAARSALNNAGGLILENYMKNCVKVSTNSNVEENDLNQLIEVMLKYTKQN